MDASKSGIRLGGGAAHERTQIANLTAALFIHKSIKTTEKNAIRLRPMAERLITFAKRGDLHARRRVLAVIHDKTVVHELFTEIAPLVELRDGGYTRITKLGFRKGDNASMVKIELVLEPAHPKPKESKKADAISITPVGKAKAPALFADLATSTRKPSVEAKQMRQAKTGRIQDKTTLRSKQAADSPARSESQNTSWSIQSAASGARSITIGSYPGKFTLAELSALVSELGITVRHFGDPDAWTLGSMSLSQSDESPALVRLVRRSEPGEGVSVEVAWRGETPSPETVAALKRSLDESAAALVEGEIG